LLMPPPEMERRPPTVIFPLFSAPRKAHLVESRLPRNHSWFCRRIFVRPCMRAQIVQEQQNGISIQDIDPMPFDRAHDGQRYTYIREGSPKQRTLPERGDALPSLPRSSSSGC